MPEARSGLNWTKVGLKGDRRLKENKRKKRLNWTKVGLKAGERPCIGAAGRRLNWTKVGLKAYDVNSMYVAIMRFELD